MQKRFTFLIALLLPCFIVQSQNINQEVIATQGNYDVGNSMTLEWTLGESFVETLNDKSIIYTQGFHQPLLKSLTNITDESYISSLVYPNPTKNSLQIILSNYDDNIFYIKMSDIHGRLIEEQTSHLKTSSLKVDVSNLPSGIYLLQILADDGNYQKTHRILKN